VLALRLKIREKKKNESVREKVERPPNGEVTEGGSPRPGMEGLAKGVS